MDAFYSDITFLLDRSGSMSHLTADTIGGFNDFLTKQKLVPGKCTINLVTFSHEFSNVYTAQPLMTVPPLDKSTYVASGNTALLDAVGRTIKETGTRLAALPEVERPGKVLFVIITDGEENSSHEYSKSAIKELIEHQQTTYKWQFIFTGANIDSFAEAGGIGITRNATTNYVASSIGTRDLYTSLASNVANYRSVSVADVNSTDYKFWRTTPDEASKEASK